MFLQWWCVPAGPGDVFDPDGARDPAGALVAPDDGDEPDDGAAGVDDDADGDDVVEAAAEVEPLADASATPVAPAPMPAARNAVMMKRRVRPPLVGVM